MDELKIRTRFMRSIVSKLIQKALRDKLMCDIDISINEIQITNENGRINFHVDADGSVSENVLTKVTQLIDEES